MKKKFNTLQPHTKTAQDNEYQLKARENKERIYNKPSIAVKIFVSLKKFFFSMYDWASSFFSTKPEKTINQIAQTSSEIGAVIVKQQAALDFLMQQHQAKRKEIDNLKSQMNGIEDKIEIVENRGLLRAYDSKKIGIQAETPPSMDAHIGPASLSLRSSG